jgi:hypothetical protein
MKSVRIWIPALRKGAPTNTAGIRASGMAYRTRAGALAHEHWANQAPWATAKAIDICDECDNSEMEQAAWNACGGLDAESAAEYDPGHAEALTHLRAKRWASAVLCVMEGWPK